MGVWAYGIWSMAYGVWHMAYGRHGRMARGSHGLPKVSPRPAMPGPATPCGRTTHETALRPFQGWLAYRVGGLRPSPTPLDTPRRAPMIVARQFYCHSHVRNFPCQTLKISKVSLVIMGS